ncbi:MAG TPA: hypothetical protein VH040_01960 [Usitatibacter sp.]|jgi:hypothetical protein|nr:hypothetical protein [Usitatibacter sp.]
MKSLRGLFASLWLALALLVGQQAAQLHDLGHALKAVQGETQDQHPGSDKCDKCSLYAPFSGAAASFVPILVAVSVAIIAALAISLPAISRTVVFSRSRAPPSLH